MGFRTNPGCGCCEPCVNKVWGNTLANYEAVSPPLTEPLQAFPGYGVTWEGVIQPVTKLNKEAYLITMQVIGVVEFVFDTIEVKVDTIGETVSVNGATSGTKIQSFDNKRSGYYCTLEVKVCPTHVYAVCWGNGYGGDELEQCGAVLHEATLTPNGTWTAEIADKSTSAIADVKAETRVVTYSGETLTVNCHQSVTYPCSKLILDELSFEENESFWGRDVAYPNVSITSSAGVNYHTSPTFTTSLGMMADETKTYTGSDTGLGFAAAGTCAWTFVWNRWETLHASGTGLWYQYPQYTQGGGDTLPLSTGNCLLSLASPTSSVPYPLLKYSMNLTLAARWEELGAGGPYPTHWCLYSSQATGTSLVGINDIESGTTLAITGSLVAEETDDIPDPPYDGDCYNNNGYAASNSVYSMSWTLF